MTFAKLCLVGVVVAFFSQSEPRVIHITAERFQFTPSEIKLQVGDVVELRLKSDDTIHGFRILNSETDAAIPKRGGGEVSVIFKAETAGRYTFECNRMCGAGHHFMRGAIVVRERAEGPVRASTKDERGMSASAKDIRR